MPVFNGTEGAPIERAVAAEWTANYRRATPGIAEGAVAKAHFFGRETLQKILDQEGCMGIRMYYGRDERGSKQLILVGVNADGRDMEAVIMDSSRVCPPDCDLESALNGSLNG